MTPRGMFDILLTFDVLLGWGIVAVVVLIIRARRDLKAEQILLKTVAESISTTPPMRKPEAPGLTPGMCWCSHHRCHHIMGTAGCQVGIKMEDGTYTLCACQCYIYRAEGEPEDDDHAAEMEQNKLIVKREIDCLERLHSDTKKDTQQ